MISTSNPNISICPSYDYLLFLLSKQANFPPREKPIPEPSKLFTHYGMFWSCPFFQGKGFSILLNYHLPLRIPCFEIILHRLFAGGTYQKDVYIFDPGHFHFWVWRRLAILQVGYLLSLAHQSIGT